MSKEKSVEKNKIKALKALENAKGIISTAANNCNLSRATIHNYIKDDPDFAQAVDMINESAIDFVEGKLFQKINGITIGKHDKDGKLIVYEVPPSDTAIIFYLKTKAKKRGYVERQEFTGKDGKDLGKWEIIIQPPNDEDKT